MLYQVAIIRKPTQEETDKGKLEELIVPPTFVVAIDEQRAALHLAARNGDAIDNEPQAAVLVRAF